MGCMQSSLKWEMQVVSHRTCQRSRIVHGSDDLRPRFDFGFESDPVAISQTLYGLCSMLMCAEDSG